ncbi:uncharacterized protein CAALFM_C108910CA [Candida albicans SC5314]|uniref:Uncharacterized protein n=1 Tax=Candida albicans (strain SC5314 / ATCC MYA-2876) TaxID=237561 RepID=A0A1D8PEG5_CANAL|nr:uncharacterized protein CAALFM_C108910CA [Candida albicans SC5314]AOW26528.1 hypothetical protein CAALFM_C108910CA [Candida albicans SC5314]|eukprot:XP_723436.2 hypothetical protein CAALFM_C108910CA [Candida albicans SC5314]
MNILRRFKTTTSTTSSSPQILLTSIEAFTARVKDEQAHNSGPLLKCIDLLIDKYQPLLVEKFKIDSSLISDPYVIQQRIWDNLKIKRSQSLDPNIKIRQELMEKNTNEMIIDHQSIPYRNFIKQLYPLKSLHSTNNKSEYFDFVNNSKKYLSINHEELYKRYLDLPHPAPRFLTFDDLQNFIYKFVLSKPHYSNRNVIEANIFKNDYQSAINSLNLEIEKRQIYHDMCGKIINDLKLANLPITQPEQIRLIYLSFFKDRQDLLKNFNPRQLKLLNYPQFNWGNYQMLIKSFGDNRRDLLSVLLLLATRHDQFDIIQDILPKVNLGCILDPGQSTTTTANTSLKLTDNSLRHLVYYFTWYIDRPNFDTYLARTIDYITNNIPVLTTDIVNSISQTLIELGYIKQAEKLFELAFFQDPKPTPPEYENSESISYKRLTTEDSIINQEWQFIYTKLKSITNDNTIIHKLIPVELTFLNLIEGYCKFGNFDQIKQLINIMDNIAKQPLSTRIYIRIFKAFINNSSNGTNQQLENDWTLDDLSSILTRLINDIDTIDEATTTTTSNTSMVKQLLNEGSLNFNKYEQEIINRKSNSDIYLEYQNNGGLKLLRISNYLLEVIFISLETKIHQVFKSIQSNDTEQTQNQYQSAIQNLKILKTNWLSMLEQDVKKRNNSNSIKSSYYYSDQLSYINKAVLFEIFSIISQL